MIFSANQIAPLRKARTAQPYRIIMNGRLRVKE
jgi:hypothetical protein